LEGDAIARLSSDSPRVRAIRAATDVARAEALAAGRWPNPRVTFNREAVSGIVENMVTVNQPLAITGRRGFEISAAEARVAATSSRADDEVQRARAELRGAFADLLLAQAREAELSQTRMRLGEVADVIGRRERAGEAAGYDRLRAEREVLDIDNDLSAAKADRARAQAALAGFFAPGTNPATLVAAPPSGPRPALPTVEELVGRAERARGEALAIQHEIDAARFSERAAERRVIPEPEVVAGTKSSNAAGGDVGSVFSVHATIPLFDRSRPERAVARARLSEAEARAAAFRQSVTMQIAGLRAVVTERRDAAERYRAATTQAEELERIAQVSYDAGERGILELLDAYRSAAAARARQATLEFTVRQAEIELEFVSGWEMQ
jgi:cobalt-zinc-cadmium efflux system outer membrane protein